MIDELVNDYCILADNGAVIFASYDHVLEFVDKIRADERKRKTLAELLSATPVDAVNMSQECVDETAKGVHEWVGFTDEEVGTLTVFNGLHHIETPLLADFIRAIESKLKEKNHG